MKKLQLWMDKKGWRDAQVAAAVKKNGRAISRVQISRIRRGLSRASVPSAKALAALTGIAWPLFIAVEPARKRTKRGA